MNDTQCSVDGCDRIAIRREWCNAHYRRWLKRGTTDTRPIPSLAERLAAKLVRMPNGCLEWTGTLNDAGYGILTIGIKRTRVHRLAWELANGPIPEGLEVCHKCDRPPCADVSHLFLGTHLDNIADMNTKERHHVGPHSATHCKRGHPFDEANTFIDHLGHRNCRACREIRKLRYEETKRD